MAVVKNEYPVNGGNTGWSKSDVISAMENAFSGLDGGAGWHSGTAKNGVPTTCFASGSTGLPNATNPSNSNWQYSAQAATQPNYRAFRYFTVTNSGSGAYNIKRRSRSDNYIYNDSQSGLESAIRFYDHELNTGDAVVWNRTDVPELTQGQTYYVISIGQEDWFQIATSPTNATNGVRVTFPVSYNIGTDTDGAWLVELGNNPTITCRQGDKIYFMLDASGHPFYVQDTVGAYDVNRVINNTNFNDASYRDFPTNQGIETGGSFSWELDVWEQGDYYYVCQLHSTMNGIIRVLPSQAGYYDYNTAPYWDYTVSGASVGAGRTDLNLRIRRYGLQSSYVGHILGIEILNEAEGWQNDDVFTIPGGSIGGASPANDVSFGVNSRTTQQQNDRTGVASIVVTDVGGNGNGGFYQRLGTNSDPGAILRIESDANKTYGVTYYGFRIDSNYQMHIGSGSDWRFLGYNPGSSTMTHNGVFNGERGMDYSSVFSSPPSMNDDDTHYKHYNFTTSTTPTSYPLKIVTYQAQSPQDTNFVVLNFVYTIGGTETTAFTFTPLKGTNIGNGIWDLDNVWNGCYLTYGYPTTEAVSINVRTPNERYYSEENAQGSGIRREAFYGYFRDADNENTDYWESRYLNNIYRDAGDNNSYISGYYRNSTYDDYTVNFQNSTYGNRNDAITTYRVNSGADYYRPFKGLPINQNMMPCPYYLPDDYVMIQFAVTPGATAFRPGDTITVSGSEVYEIIRVSYSTNQLGLDNINNNTSKGIAFCARTT